MSQDDLIAQAKAGDASAIAMLINQALQPKGVTAQATRQGSQLNIVLQSPQCPDAAACVRVIHNGLLRLQPVSIAFVKIYGRQPDQNQFTWTETLLLSPVTAPQPTPQLSQPLPKKTVPKFSIPRIKFPTVTLPKQSIQPQRSISKPWLIASSISLVALPLSAFWFNQNQVTVFTQLAAIPNAISSGFSKFPLLSLAGETPPNSIPKTETLQNLNTVSQFTLSTLQNPINPDLRITIKAVGDIIPGTNYPYNKLSSNKASLFKAVKPALQDADLVFGNFESTLTNYPNSAKSIGRGLVFAFRTPPEYTALLKDAGFDVLSVANNHSFDFFETGFKDTIQNIQKEGMKAIGKKGEIVYDEVKGVKIAFIAFSNYDYHNNLSDTKAGEKLVKEAQKKADFVVISFHGGAEGTGALNVKNKTEYFYGENRGNLVQFSHSMIDAGADLVLGHGPHVPRALELYKGKLIAYSLGNFMGYRTLSTAAQLGYSLVLEVKVNPLGDFVEGQIIPVQLDSQGIPYLDSRGKTIDLMQNLTATDFPKTPLKITEDGKIRISNQ